VTHVPRRPAQSTIAVELIRHEWMVVQRMTAEDAREVAWAFGDRDGVYRELMDAADEADAMNEETP
jgi:hypothetical protein